MTVTKIVYIGFRAKDSYEIHLRYANKKISEAPIIYGLLKTQHQI